MNADLRNPTARDFATVASWIRTAQECERWAGPNLRFPFAPDDLPGLLAAAAAVVEGEAREPVVLCLSSGAVVGYGELVREDASSFRLARIVIAPDQRSQGLGRVLCRQLIERAKAQQAARRVRLFVYRDNRVAQRLYSGLRFVEAPPHPRAEIMAMELRI